MSIREKGNAILSAGREKNRSDCNVSERGFAWRKRSWNARSLKLSVRESVWRESAVSENGMSSWSSAGLKPCVLKRPSEPGSDRLMLEEEMTTGIRITSDLITVVMLVAVVVLVLVVAMIVVLSVAGLMIVLQQVVVVMIAEQHDQLQQIDTRIEAAVTEVWMHQRLAMERLHQQEAQHLLVVELHGMTTVVVLVLQVVHHLQDPALLYQPTDMMGK